MNQRLEQLDSLRGLAALSVLIGHFLNMIPSVLGSTHDAPHSLLIGLIKFTPLHIIWAGSEAVILFFVLSGFVLMLPFLKPDAHISYGAYLLKRICRIYIPYVISLFIAVLAIHLFYTGKNPALTGLYNMIGQRPIDGKLFLNHLLLIGSFENFRYNPVIWSLIQEMRISIIFPLIAWFVKKYDWKKTLLMGSILCFALYYGARGVEHLFAVTTDYPDTFVYLIMFLVGAILAKYRVALTEAVKQIKPWMKSTLFLFAVCMATFFWWFYYLGFQEGSILKSKPFFELIITCAVVIFILLSLDSNQWSKFLERPALTYLGKISYSLYLYHLVCLVALITILFGKIPLWSILIISFFASFAVSILFYYAIELPAMKLGQLLYRLTNKQGKATQTIQQPNHDIDLVAESELLERVSTK